ncbi:DUF6363 domain-containing protein, partial [Bacillus sp. B-TM1]
AGNASSNASQSMWRTEPIIRLPTIINEGAFPAFQVDRMEKDTAKLQNLYEQGYEDAKRQFADLKAFLQK